MKKYKMLRTKKQKIDSVLNPLMTVDQIKDLIHNNGFTTVIFGNTMFICSSELGLIPAIKHWNKFYQEYKTVPAYFFPTGYIKLSVKKQQKQARYNAVCDSIKRAKYLEAYLRSKPEINYFAILNTVKKNKYRVRTNLDRDLNTVISPVYYYSPNGNNNLNKLSLVESWNALFCGYGENYKGKNIDPITCIEKIRKTLVTFIDALNTEREKVKLCSTCAGYKTDVPWKSCVKCNGMY